MFSNFNNRSDPNPTDGVRISIRELLSELHICVLDTTVPSYNSGLFKSGLYILKECVIKTILLYTTERTIVGRFWALSSGTIRQIIDSCKNELPSYIGGFMDNKEDFSNCFESFISNVLDRLYTDYDVLWISSISIRQMVKDIDKLAVFDNTIDEKEDITYILIPDLKSKVIKACKSESSLIGDMITSHFSYPTSTGVLKLAFNTYLALNRLACSIVYTKDTNQLKVETMLDNLLKLPVHMSWTEGQYTPIASDDRISVKVNYAIYMDKVILRLFLIDLDSGIIHIGLQCTLTRELSSLGTQSDLVSTSVANWLFKPMSSNKMANVNNTNISITTLLLASTTWELIFPIMLLNYYLLPYDNHMDITTQDMINVMIRHTEPTKILPSRYRKANNTEQLVNTKRAISLPTTNIITEFPEIEANIKQMDEVKTQVYTIKNPFAEETRLRVLEAQKVEDARNKIQNLKVALDKVFNYNSEQSYGLSLNKQALDKMLKWDEVFQRVRETIEQNIMIINAQTIRNPSAIYNNIFEICDLLTKLCSDVIRLKEHIITYCKLTPTLKNSLTSTKAIIYKLD